MWLWSNFRPQNGTRNTFVPSNFPAHTLPLLRMSLRWALDAYRKHLEFLLRLCKTPNWKQLICNNASPMRSIWHTKIVWFVQMRRRLAFARMTMVAHLFPPKPANWLASQIMQMASAFWAHLMLSLVCYLTCNGSRVLLTITFVRNKSNIESYGTTCSYGNLQIKQNCKEIIEIEILRNKIMMNNYLTPLFHSFKAITKIKFSTKISRYLR